MCRAHWIAYERSSESYKICRAIRAPRTAPINRWCVALSPHRRCVAAFCNISMQCNAIQCNMCVFIYNYIYNAVQCSASMKQVKICCIIVQIQHQLVVVSRFGILMRKIATGSGSSALRQFLLSHYLTTKSSVIAGLMQCAPPQQNLHGSSWSFFQRSASA
jgi:hypothetical protein